MPAAVCCSLPEIEADPLPILLIPVLLLSAAAAVHLWRSGSRWPAIAGGAAASLAIPLATYFLARPMYHFVLVSYLLLLMVNILRSRG
jgi:hypothetical protein